MRRGCDAGSQTLCLMPLVVTSVLRFVEALAVVLVLSAERRGQVCWVHEVGKDRDIGYSTLRCAINAIGYDDSTQLEKKLKLAVQFNDLQVLVRAPPSLALPAWLSALQAHTVRALSLVLSRTPALPFSSIGMLCGCLRTRVTEGGCGECEGCERGGCGERGG